MALVGRAPIPRDVRQWTAIGNLLGWFEIKWFGWLFFQVWGCVALEEVERAARKGKESKGQERKAKAQAKPARASPSPSKP